MIEFLDKAFQDKPMETKNLTTKLALINAAGELFAEHGFEGTSIRAIADKAQVNIAGIKYHFGSKEALYLHTISHVFESGKNTDLEKIIEEKQLSMDDKEGVANLILDLVICCYEDVFCSGQPDWHTKLIMQEVLHNDCAIEYTVDYYFRPKHKAVVDLYKKVKPESTTAEAYVWGFTLYSQIVFLMQMEKMLAVLTAESCEQSEILKESVKLTAMSMICKAELPMPKRITNNEIELEG